MHKGISLNGTCSTMFFLAMASVTKVEYGKQKRACLLWGALWLPIIGMGAVADSTTPEMGFTELKLPDGISVFSSSICVHGFNFSTTHNTIAQVTGSYGSEKILYNAWVPDNTREPTSTAIIINNENQQEIARLNAASKPTGFWPWGVNDVSSEFKHAIGSAMEWGVAKNTNQIVCQGGAAGTVDFVNRFVFVLPQYWEISSGQPVMSQQLVCGKVQDCVPYVVSDDGLSIYGFDYLVSAFVTWSRTALSQKFSDSSIIATYPYQGTPLILSISEDKTKLLYQAASQVNCQVSTFLLSLKTNTSTELLHIPNTYGLDASNKSTIITEQHNQVVKLPLSEAETGKNGIPFSANTLSDFENNDWRLMPIQHLTAETLAGYPIKRHTGPDPEQTIDSVIWVPDGHDPQTGSLINALDYWIHHCRIDGIEHWTLDNHLNSIYQAIKQSNGMVSYYGYYRNKDNPDQESVLYRITVDYEHCDPVIPVSRSAIIPTLSVSATSSAIAPTVPPACPSCPALPEEERIGLIAGASASGFIAAVTTIGMIAAIIYCRARGKNGMNIIPKPLNGGYGSIPEGDFQSMRAAPPP